MGWLSKTLGSIIDSIIEAKKDETEAYDSSATVLRDDGDILWVHIPGGVDETPIKKTIDAKRGDVIQVRVGGGTAWATGNQTAPPTDDTTAVKADKKASEANIVAKLAQKTADKAGKTATNYLSWSSQYGLIVSEDATEDPTEMTGGSTRIISDGMEVYKGQNRVAKFSEVSVLGKTDGTNQNLTIDPSTGLIVKRGNTEISRIGFGADDHSGGLKIDNTINGSSLFMSSTGVSLMGATFKTYRDSIEHSYYTTLLLPSKTTGPTTSDGFNRLVIALHEYWDDGAFHSDNVIHYFDRSGLFVDGSVKSNNLPAMMECGAITNVSNVASHSYADYQVTFSKAFSSAPIVVVGMMSSSTGYGVGSVSVSAHSITATGFTARIFNNDSSARSPYIHWIAMLQ